MVRKMFIHEPIDDSFTPSLAVIVTRVGQIKHQKKDN